MSPAVRGWCPTAHRPMQSGDGLILRVRPRHSVLSAADLRVLADLAEEFGQGVVEVTSRAGLQIRGVAEAGVAPLLAELTAQDLVEKTPEEEAQRAILSAPGALAAEIAAALAGRLVSADALELPSKFGFLIDPGPGRRHLAGISGDVRIEAGQGGLILRADGCDCGLPVAGADAAAAAALALADWFAAARGADGPTRMKGLIAAGACPPAALCGDARPAPTAAALQPGLGPLGLAVGAPFGQFTAPALRRIADAATDAIHVSPYRLLVLIGRAAPLTHDDLIVDAADPILRVQSCAGAPACAQGEAETRRLARALAARLGAEKTAHVSGCAKGCAHPAAADLTLVGRGGRYDWIAKGGVGDAPLRRGLTAADVIEMLENA